MIDYKHHKNAIETLYNSIMTVYEVTEQAINGAPSRVKTRRAETEKTLYVNEPCFVSYESNQVVVGDAPTVSQTITLICSDELEIPEGSTIDIVKGGRVKRFKASGVADHLISHQEIPLKAIDYAR